jgi:hypothetical protein
LKLTLKAFLCFTCNFGKESRDVGDVRRRQHESSHVQRRASGGVALVGVGASAEQLLHTIRAFRRHGQVQRRRALFNYCSFQMKPMKMFFELKKPEMGHGSLASECPNSRCASSWEWPWTTAEAAARRPQPPCSFNSCTSRTLPVAQATLKTSIPQAKFKIVFIQMRLMHGGVLRKKMLAVKSLIYFEMKHNINLGLISNVKYVCVF